MTKGVVLISLLILLIQAQIIPTSVDTCCKSNQIQASGEGKASAQPDMAVISLRFNEKGKKSADAVKALSDKVNQALAVLKANGYGNEAYETGSINVYAEYSYQNGRSEVIGQQASQTLTVRVRNLDAKGQKVGVLVDALAQINGINIDSVTFDIYDKTPLQTQARAAAFKDAKAKAEDYASFAGLSVGRVLTIDDFSYVAAPPIAAEKRVFAAMVAGGASADTSVPVGEQDVTYSTTITFALR